MNDGPSCPRAGAIVLNSPLPVRQHRGREVDRSSQCRLLRMSSTKNDCSQFFQAKGTLLARRHYDSNLEFYIDQNTRLEPRFAPFWERRVGERQRQLPLSKQGCLGVAYWEMRVRAGDASNGCSDVSLGNRFRLRERQPDAWRSRKRP